MSLAWLGLSRKQRSAFRENLAKPPTSAWKPYQMLKIRKLERQPNCNSCACLPGIPHSSCTSSPKIRKEIGFRTAKAELWELCLDSNEWYWTNKLSHTFITVACKSQESKDPIPIPTLHELGIQFSQQPREGPGLDFGPRLKFPAKYVN